jgi:hypothetical protein
MDIPIDKFQEKTTKQKKDFFTKDETLKEWDSLKGGHNIKIKRGTKGKVLSGFKIYGWEPSVMLKFKYLSKNANKIKNKDKFWDSVIWHENKKLSDTDILDPTKYNINKPFRILTKEESTTAGQSKLVRNIMKEDNPNNKKNEAATKIQAQVRGQTVRNKGKKNNNEGKKNNNEVPNGDCKGTNKKCPDVDKRIKGKNMSNIGRQAICKSYAGCDWIKKGGRKKKRKKAFPSRRKNNRKNRTKKKALSKRGNSS